MLLAHYGCPMGQKALSDGEQVYMPNMAKIWQKLPKKCTKLAVNHQNGTNFGQRGCFSVVLARARHFEGCNIAQLCRQHALQNSAPNVRRLPEKPLKTLLAHQNDHRRRKKGKVAFLEFNFEHFKG